MPKAPKLKLDALWEKLRVTLRQRACGGGELREVLGVSQPALSMLIKAHKQELFIVGKTKSAAYALPREMAGVPGRIQVYRIDAEGKGVKVGTLTAVYPEGAFHWEGEGKGQSGFHGSLPFFLEDLRPGGYLGALLPRLHPELEAPQDVTKWNTAHCLRYLTRFGCDLIGDFVLGDEAYALYLERKENPGAVKAEERLGKYEEFAGDVLALGDPGSSAAGEQPKFLCTKRPHAKVIVKFSPKKDDARAKRQADLLWCEAIALGVLGRRGFAVEKAEVLEGKSRTFLEVERFDRVGKHGRLGMVSLRVLDAEFVGKAEGWSAVGEALFRQKKIGKEDLGRIRTLDLFGALIANSDRHLGNLSFFVSKEGALKLAPVYDMLPMLYFPKVEVVARVFACPQPAPSLAREWREALPAAMEFWAEVAGHKGITGEFRAIAKENLGQLKKLETKVAALPE